MLQHLADTDFEKETLTLGGRTLHFRSIRNIAYCESPKDPIQRMNLFAPEAHFEGGTVSGYTKDNAPPSSAQARSAAERRHRSSTSRLPSAISAPMRRTSRATSTASSRTARLPEVRSRRLPAPREMLPTTQTSSSASALPWTHQMPSSQQAATARSITSSTQTWPTSGSSEESATATSRTSGGARERLQRSARTLS